MGLLDLFRKRHKSPALETPIREAEQSTKAALALAKYCDYTVNAFAGFKESTPERNNDFVHDLITVQGMVNHLLSDELSAYLTNKVHASVRARLSGASLKLNSILENEDQIRATDQSTLRLVAMIAHLAETVHGVLSDHPDYIRSARG